MKEEVKLKLEKTSIVTLASVKLLVDREEYKVFARDAAEKLRLTLKRILPIQSGFFVFPLLIEKCGCKFGVSWPYIILTKGSLEDTVARIIKQQAEKLGVKTEI